MFSSEIILSSIIKFISSLTTQPTISVLLTCLVTHVELEHSKRLAKIINYKITSYTYR